MMITSSIIAMSALELQRRMAHRELSPVDVTVAYLDRIDRFDATLHAYITVMRNEALRAARQAERGIMRGDALGPLHGLPLGVKDQFLTEGVRTTAGSRILADYVPEVDATVVARARAAGGILLGKLNTSEFAAVGGDPFIYGDPHNPWDLERGVGASSAGSAIAIAASLCAIALGEDTGGSIRGPAAHAGIVGVRPTWGLVSRYGALPISWSMDAAGPMTRTVEDAALVLTVIAGHDKNDALSSRRPVIDYLAVLNLDLRRTRIGVIQEFMDPNFVHAEVARSVREAAAKMEEMGASIADISLPLLRNIAVVRDVISGSDGAFVHRDRLRTQAKDLGPTFRRRWIANSLIPAVTLEKAWRLRTIFRREWRRLFARFDILLSPTAFAPAGKIAYESALTSRDEAERRLGSFRSPTVAASLAGTPAMTIPCGFTAEGLPIGLQLMADYFREDLMLNAAYAYQQATTWHLQRPRLDDMEDR